MDQKIQKLVAKLCKYAAPPPNIKPSEWMEENFVLNESAFAPGRWRADAVPYQKEIIDAFADPNVREITIMAPSQWGKNIILSGIEGFVIAIMPGPILHIGTTVDEMEKYSKGRFARFIRDTKCLKDKIFSAKSRDSNNTILLKLFPGGFLEFIGSNSPRAAASKPIQVVVEDELDGFETTIEGDISEIADRRLVTFRRLKKSKRIRVSSPHIKGFSKIEKAYFEGTQEEWLHECPGCLKHQFVDIYKIKFEHARDEKGNYTVWDVVFQCPDCLGKFTEIEWKEAPVRYIALNPEAYERGHRSFKGNSFDASQSWTWKEIVLKWLQVKTIPDEYKVFKNTVLNESWEEKGEIADCEYLLKRREDYGAELPDGVLVLTAGADVQDDRLEYEIVGWGRGEQSWGVEYGMIMGKPDKEQTWEDLWNKYDQIRKFKNGVGLIVACGFTDSGGHYTEKVYEACKKVEARRIYAIKGQGGPGIPLIYKWYRTKKENAWLFILGVDSGKSRIIGRLKMPEVGDGYCHFPLGGEKGYDRIYFQGLTSEALKKGIEKGKMVLRWVKTNANQRNEPLDCRNYAQAALSLLNPNWDAYENRLKTNTGGATNIVKKAQNLIKNTKKRVVKGANDD